MCVCVGGGIGGKERNPVPAFATPSCQHHVSLQLETQGGRGAYDETRKRSGSVRQMDDVGVS